LSAFDVDVDFIFVIGYDCLFAMQFLMEEFGAYLIDGIERRSLG
jgi:hypothetical protein